MDKQDVDVERLRRELDYYKRNIDRFAGDSLRRDMSISRLQHELKQKRQGLALLSELQQSIGAYKDIWPIFEATIQATNATLGMDKTVVLTPTDEENCYRPSQWLGFHEDETEKLSSLQFTFPPEFAEGAGLFLVTKSSESCPPLVEDLRSAFALPYFVCLPVMVDSAPIGLLLSGRLTETLPFYPPLDQGDVDTFQAVAGLISASMQNMMLAQEQFAREVLEKTNIQLSEAKEAAEAANKAKSTFLASMSHEIRTPLNAVIGYAQILQRDPELGPRQQEAASVIESGGEHLLALVNDILDISKIESGHIELQEVDFNLSVFIEELSTMFQLRCQQKGIRWRSEVKATGEPPILVHGDLGKLRQILINLLGNAVKFTESGEVALLINEDGEHSGLFLFEVVDTGSGISQSDQAIIFDTFQQGERGIQKGGTGLGLAISKRQIELMGGELSLESEPGHGSRFSFTVSLPPARGDLSTHRREKVSLRLADGYSLKALVVDDIKENRNILGQTLSHIGASVQLAENGVQALEMVRADIPDIIFMDIRMPTMNGVEATRRIWQELGKDKIKIVAVSASALKHEQEGFLREGFHDFIPKPFHVEQVCECLRNLLQVEYVVKQQGEEKERPPSEYTALPEEILTSLTEAAKTHNVTRVGQCLEQLRQTVEDGHPLLGELYRLFQNYDMDGILKVSEDNQTRGMI